MSIELQEGALVFSLSATRALKGDGAPAYRDGLERLDGTKAVDIVADVEGAGLVLIEVKDFRGPARASGARRKAQTLAMEVADKVRDTLAGMIWACGRTHADDKHVGLVRAATSAQKPLVVLWLEEDGRVDVGGTVALAAEIRRLLKPWLRANVQVCSMRLAQDNPVPGVTVRFIRRPRAMP